jgi:hypothetical protein
MLKNSKKSERVRGNDAELSSFEFNGFLTF